MNNNNYSNLCSYYISNFSSFEDVIKQLFIVTPIKNFAYQRFYIGGQHLIFLSNQDYSKHFFETVHDLGEYFGSAVRKSRPEKLNYYLWPKTPEHDHVFEGMMHYNIWNGFTIYIRKTSYVEAYYFGCEKNTDDMSNFYLNNIELLKDFIVFFNNKLWPVINVKNDKVLGRHTGKSILDGFDDSEEVVFFSGHRKKINLTVDNKNINVTPKEFECLSLISKGFTNKFSAKKLAISPRTFECHLENIKFKTGFCTKNLLLEWFNDVNNSAQLFNDHLRTKAA